MNWRKWWPFSELFACHRSLGVRGERAAARFLESKGWKVLQRSFRCQGGELDLIAAEGEVIVFVEVKTRESEDRGAGWQAVDRSKQRTIARCAEKYLRRHRLHDRPIRFDVISIVWPSGEDPNISHFPNAFESFY